MTASAIVQFPPARAPCRLAPAGPEPVSELSQAGRHLIRVLGQRVIPSGRHTCTGRSPSSRTSRAAASASTRPAERSAPVPGPGCRVAACAARHSHHRDTAHPGIIGAHDHRFTLSCRPHDVGDEVAETPGVASAGVQARLKMVTSRPRAPLACSRPQRISPASSQVRPPGAGSRRQASDRRRGHRRRGAPRTLDTWAVTAASAFPGRSQRRFRGFPGRQRP